MRKKLLCAILSAFLTAGMILLCAVPAAAEEEEETPSEVLAFSAGNIQSDGSYLYEGECFRITAGYANDFFGGIYAGSDEYWLTVEAIDPNVTITGVDAVISYWGGLYYEVGISRGRKLEAFVTTGSTVHVVDIGSNTFSFAGGLDRCCFGDITVYYRVDDHAHVFDTYAINDDSTHSNKCIFCDTVSETENHCFEFAPGDVDNGDGTHSGTCACGLTGVGVHDFSDGNTCACGAESFFEKLVFDESNIRKYGFYLYEGEHFRITADSADEDGIYAGDEVYWLTVEATAPNVTITRIDAVVNFIGSYYDEVGLSAGRKFREGKVKNGTTVNVLEINSGCFSFENGTNYSQFGDITVYYRVEDHDHDFSTFTVNSDGTHSKECSLCGAYGGRETHFFAFAPGDEDNGDGTHTGTCACGLTGVGVHDFSDGNTCACGAESLFEELAFDKENIRLGDVYFFEGEHFRITADYAYTNGIDGGDNDYRLRIEATVPNVTITRVDAVVSSWGDYYEEVGVSRGRKFQTGEVRNGSTVNVLGIGSNVFSFAGGSDNSRFGDITVYYRVEEHDHDFSTDCTSVDDCSHTGECSVCGIIGEAEHVYDPEDNADGTHTGECSVCGHTVTELHVFKGGVCACGVKSLIEELVFDEDNIQSDDSYFFEGEHFRVTGVYADSDGIYGGSNSYPLRIEAKDTDVTITRVDAVVSYYGYYYDEVGISSGRKIQNGEVEIGSTVNVLDIDSDSFAFEDGTDGVYFSDITVYYDIHEHSFDEFTDNGNGTYTAVCECGEELTVTASYEYYFVNGQKPIAGGENGTVNKRAYYVDDEGAKVELEAGLLEEDLEVTFAEWYLRTAIQFKETEDGGVNVRFVSMLDENLDDYYEAGFTYTVGGADTFDPLTTQFGNTSYIADSKTVKAGDFGLGEEYFILRDVDFAKEAVDADLEISVTPYVLLTDGVTYITGEAVSFRLGDLVGAEEEAA